MPERILAPGVQIEQEGSLSYRGLLSGARAAFVVAGAATAVGFALVNDRRTPAFALATATYPAAPPSVYLPRPIAVGSRRAWQLPDVRALVAGKLAFAVVLGALALAVAASLPAISALASTLRVADPPAAAGPSASLRAGAGLGGNDELSESLSVPSARQIGSALMAAALEQRYFLELKSAMAQIATERDAAARAAASTSSSRAAAAPHSLNRASGIAPGTQMRARITIYGCQGPGGGFCNNMAGGGRPFAGAAACSSDLPFGTKLTINGDPTGRVYECLDRGALPATWVDVYFENTTDGMAWQSALGSTLTTIEIAN